MTTDVTRYTKPFGSLALVIACSLALQAAAPAGWFLAGSKPASYETGTDAQAAYNGDPSVYLKSKEPVREGFGTLMQEFRANKYGGKRLRLSAFVKSEGVQEWAGLWMRVDKGNDPVAFDNMQNRPIKGTTDWQKYEVVLDVPQDATGIFFGVLLSGSGTVWLNNVKLEAVEADVPTTGQERAPAPR
jgi:hypothetical protein